MVPPPMGYIVNMPKLGLEMEEGTVLEWTVDEGGDVEEDDVLAEIESEKSIGEVEAREDGVLRRVFVEVDEAVPPGTPIGIVAAADEDIDDLESEARSELDAATGEGSGEEAAEAAAEESTGSEPEPGASGSGTEASAAGEQSESTASDDVKATPRAEKRAEELGVELAAVEGTGPQGAITESDVEDAAEAAETAGTSGESGAEPEARSRGRAERIVPDRPEQHRYERTTAVLDAEAAEAVFEAKRAAENALDVDASATDVLLVVLAAALREVPEMNATFEESTHHLHESQHVALVAPADGDGLATSVVADLDEQSFADLVEARRKTGDGGEDAGADVTPTFTVADGAAFDDAAGKVVNPPAVAALAVDAVGQRATPAENGVDLQPHATCGVTFDTRAVDQRVVERFFDSLDANARDASELVMKTFAE